jgi:hypothetical protein
MFSKDLESKFDIVIVNKKSSGKFPGIAAKKSTIGLVWGIWKNNHTTKISILDENANLYFSTANCVEKVGKIFNFEKIIAAYKSYADLNFIPAFAFVKINSLEIRNFIKYKKGEIKNRPDVSFYIKIKFLYRKNFSIINMNSIHPDDLDILLNSNNNFHCLRLEKYILENF